VTRVTAPGVEPWDSCPSINPLVTMARSRTQSCCAPSAVMSSWLRACAGSGRSAWDMSDEEIDAWTKEFLDAVLASRCATSAPLDAFSADRPSPPVSLADNEARTSWAH